ncbi:MAG: MOSC domain-containing protein [Albidovulum sp.]
MPALIATDHYATVTWLGRVPGTQQGIASVSAESLMLTLAGAEGEAHSGLTRPSCSRVMGLYPRGTTIRNTRQLAIASAEDLRTIAAEMGLDHLAPEYLGLSVVIEGIVDFSHVPPSSRLQAESGATLTIDMENRPCTLPAREIEAAHPGFGKAFKPAAAGRRGVVAWVEREGLLSLGDRLRLHVPDQPAWAGKA